ncbi:Quinone oxidoreductase (EC [Olavius algarvensis associated proteobacterium Delta 3]|nr:Quinone oxidoreductase (EC [Olavius algarvensis associated proteobacterium Delta 3]
MKAAWYERQGPPSEVLVVGEMTTPEPGPRDVRIRVAASGVNPGDVKKRQDTFGVGMPYPRVIPHSDGAGVIEGVGDRVSSSRIGERVWCFGAQSYRPFGTAAEYVVVPDYQAIPLPDGIAFEQGACLGIPGITAHRAVHVAGSVHGQAVLVQGGAGAVGQCAVGLARHAGALVIATVRSERDAATAQRAGAHHVIVTGGLLADEIVGRVFASSPDGIDHIVEVAFHPNISVDERLLKQGGTIATYATGDPTPEIPFWPLVFKNVRLFFLGSDDFPTADKIAAASALNEALECDWPGFDVETRFSLESIAKAHEVVEERKLSGRVVVGLQFEELAE